MTWFKNLNVKTKLLASFATVIIFVITLVLLAYSTVNSLDNNYTYILEYPAERSRILSDIDSHGIDIRRAASTLSLYADDPALVDTYWKELETAYDEALKNIDYYLKNIESDHVREPAEVKSNIEIMTGVRKQIETYKANYADRAVAIARSSGDVQLTGDAFKEGAGLVSGALDTIAELIAGADVYTQSISDQNTVDKDASIRIFIILSALAVIISIFISLFISSLISNPLAALTAFMKKAGSTGDITLQPDEKATLGNYAQFKDEIGQCIDSSVHFVGHMVNIGASLETIANGDLTEELKLLSDKDRMGLSLNKMLDNLNMMFSEINSASSQVTIGSEQVSSGSQSLAQGSTEQASSVEELSASISEISDKTKQNAGMAEEAANLSGHIRNNAEKGSSQMDKLMEAVNEINEASQSISKVIKVIDDIAFQTNILALNAAVEAARAGQHGKGFAVVADEVRNLAAKSAASAQDTGGLIESSMEKSKLGLVIATETATSLKDIVDGINKSADIVAKIAKSSNEQSTAISQINIGINQVSQVIQQNSATAEESAAASEEMTGQASILQEHIKRFKLRTKNSFEPSAKVEFSAKSDSKQRISNTVSSHDFEYTDKY